MEFYYLPNKTQTNLPALSGEYFASNDNYSNWKIHIRNQNFEMKKVLFIEKSPPRALNGTVPNDKNS
jgi:hypothetical protein